MEGLGYGEILLRRREDEHGVKVVNMEMKLGVKVIEMSRTVEDPRKEMTYHRIRPPLENSHRQ